MNFEKYKYQIWLHIAVVVFGLTGILGKLITLDAYHLVWYRLVIAILGLLVYFSVTRRELRLEWARLKSILGVGVVLAAHWVTFFEAIKQSNVSVGLVCFSSMTVFVSLLEPIYYKRRIAGHELVFGVFIIVGLYFAFSFEFEYINGMIFGVVSAVLAAWFTVLNGLLIRETDARKITFWELCGALVGLTLYMLLWEGFDAEQLAISGSDFGWLLILGIVCTAFSFMLSVQLVKRITPYNFVMAVNLEPIYAVLMAYLIWPATETMSPGFYGGGAIVLLIIFLNTAYKRRLLRRQARE